MEGCVRAMTGTEGQARKAKPSQMAALIRPHKEWDDIDELFYRTGCAFWFIASDEFQMDVICDNAYWRVVHGWGKPDWNEVAEYNRRHPRARFR